MRNAIRSGVSFLSTKLGLSCIFGALELRRMIVFSTDYIMGRSPNEAEFFPSKKTDPQEVNYEKIAKTIAMRFCGVGEIFNNTILSQLPWP